MGNINVILLVFVMGGFALFSTLFISEQSGVESTGGSLINDVTGLFLTPPSIPLSNVTDCSGFTDCTAALFTVLLRVVQFLIYAIVDILVLILLLLVIFINPLPDAPIYIKLFVWALEIGGLTVVINVLKPASDA